MKSRIFVSALLLLSLLLGCSRDQVKQAAKLIDPRYPKKAATHIVELYKVQIGAPDFGVSTFGNPLSIKVSLKENGQEIASNSETTILNGQRGERVLQKPIQWVVNFSPQKNYQIYLEEQAIIASAHSWSIPGTPKLGYWPVAENKGHIAFGQESYLEFRDRVAE